MFIEQQSSILEYFFEVSRVMSNDAENSALTPQKKYII